MGNKESKNLPPGIVKDSEEYWWYQCGRNLAPVESCEEFCKRYKDGLVFFLQASKAN